MFQKKHIDTHTSPFGGNDVKVGGFPHNNDVAAESALPGFPHHSTKFEKHAEGHMPFEDHVKKMCKGGKA